MTGQWVPLSEFITFLNYFTDQYLPKKVGRETEKEQSSNKSVWILINILIGNEDLIILQESSGKKHM